MQQPQTTQLFFDLHLRSSPPISSLSLEALVQLASLRRSLFSSDEVCARAFVATPPDDGDSRNANNTYWRDYPGRELDLFACDEHAFCHACAAGNAYCEAVLQKYHHWESKTTGAGSTPSDVKGYVYKYLDNYWCRDDVLSAIAARDGSFLAGVESGKF